MGMGERGFNRAKRRKAIDYTVVYVSDCNYNLLVSLVSEKRVSVIIFVTCVNEAALLFKQTQSVRIILMDTFELVWVL